MAARRERGLLDPNAAPGESVFDHQIYAMASDGDIEEGVSSEASSLAGTQQLGNLTLIYDENKISIEDDTDVALSEDVAKRYEAYGWHVQVVDWTNDGARYEEDVPALYKAIRAAERVTDQPSIIVLRTIIAWPAPNAQNTGEAHGSALGDDEVAATKKILGFDPEQTFEVAEDVIEHTRKAVDRGKDLQAQWREKYAAWTRKPSRRPGPVRADGDAHPARRVGQRPAVVARRPEGRGHPQGVRRGDQRGRPARCPSCGAARPTWPGPTTPPSRTRRRSSRRAAPRRCGRATRTPAGCCTSASASTAWARSSTASRRTAAPASSGRRS